MLPEDVWIFMFMLYRTPALWGRCPTLIQLLHLIAASRALLTLYDPWMTSFHSLTENRWDENHEMDATKFEIDLSPSILPPTSDDQNIDRASESSTSSSLTGSDQSSDEEDKKEVNNNENNFFGLLNLFKKVWIMILDF